MHYGINIVLSDSWTKYEVPVSQLTIPDDSDAARLGLTWDKVRGAVCRLEFDLPQMQNKVGDTLLFQLDNIRLHGIGIEELLK